MRTDGSLIMNRNKYCQNQNQKADSAARVAGAADANKSEIDFAPAPDEVARKACFTYVNQGSRDGHGVQHWLAAEAELIAERNLT